MNLSERAWRGLACLLTLSALPTACGSSSEPGVRVELISEQSLRSGQELSTGSGVVRVEEVNWTSLEIELQGCASARAALKNWFVPEAHAHGTSTSTLRAVPTIVSATAAGGVQLGELEPPTGHYCAVRYRVAPADADAVGLASAPGMLGRSFLLRGEFRPTSGELQALDFVSQQTFDVTLDIDLELSSDQRGATLIFAHDAERWFQGMNLVSLGGDSPEEAILDAFRSSFSVRLETE